MRNKKPIGAAGFRQQSTKASCQPPPPSPKPKPCVERPACPTTSACRAPLSAPWFSLCAEAMRVSAGQHKVRGTVQRDRKPAGRARRSFWVIQGRCLCILQCPLIHNSAVCWAYSMTVTMLGPAFGFNQALCPINTLPDKHCACRWIRLHGALLHVLLPCLVSAVTFHQSIWQIRLSYSTPSPPPPPKSRSSNVLLSTWVAKGRRLASSERLWQWM